MIHKLLLALPLVAALPQSYGDAWPGHGHSTAYFLENNPNGNNIVALSIGTDGRLSNPIRTSTGGRGAIAVNGSNVPVQADSLGTQGAVVVSNDLLFTVNAGDDTVSMFKLDAQQPQHPRLVGAPVSSLGEFPVSVPYSDRLNQVCVLNGGAKAGVACLSVDLQYGLKNEGPLRALNASIIDETTPPSGPPGQASEILFDPASDALFATIRGVPGTRLGSFLAWPVENGQVAEEAVLTQKSDLMLDFAFTFINEKEIFLVDPTFGASLLEVGTDYKLTETVHTPIAGQIATCWAVYDWEFGTLYAIDAGSNNIYLLDAKSGQVKGNLTATLPAGHAGLFDTSIQSGVLYALAASNGIVAIDLVKKQQLQYLDLSSFGNRQYYQGFAVW